MGIKRSNMPKIDDILTSLLGMKAFCASTKLLMRFLITNLCTQFKALRKIGYWTILPITEI